MFSNFYQLNLHNETYSFGEMNSQKCKLKFMILRANLAIGSTNFIEMKLILKSGKPKRLMGFKAHHDGFKPIDSLEWWSVCSLHETEANVNLLVNWKKDLRLPKTTFSNRDGNLSLMGLYRSHLLELWTKFTI